MKKILTILTIFLCSIFSISLQANDTNVKELQQIVEQYVANYKILKSTKQSDIHREQVVLKAKFVNNIHNLTPSKNEFYNTLYKVYKSYVSGKDEEELKQIIDDYVAKISTSKTNLDEDRVEAYKELLSYLRANIDVFSNDILNQIGINTTHYVDKHLPQFLQGKGVGSLIICALFLILVYFLRGILIRLLKWVISKFYKDHSRLNHIFKQINKPLLILISLYSIFICVRFYYYPNPISLVVAKVFGILFSISIAYLAIAILNSWGIVLVEKLVKKQNSQDIVNLLLKVIDCLIVLIAILSCLSAVGFDVSAIIASLGIGGLALALAAKDIIANFFASILLAFDDSFSQGDWVIINGVEGLVVETGLRKTSIRTFDNTLVFLPNSSVLGGNIQNFSKRKFGRKMVLTVGLTYDTTKEQLKNFLDKVTELIENDDLVAHNTDDEFNTHKQVYNKQKFVSLNDLEGYRASIYVWVDDFASSSIDVKLYFYTKTVSAASYYKAKSELMLKIMALVEEQGLSFAFPSQSLYIEKMPKID